MQGFYGSLHRGASSGTSDPEGWELYTGGNYPTWRQIFKPFEVDGASLEATRHVYRQVPALGQAASAPPEISGVPANDRPHSLSLDGHQGSAVSNHPNGLFAQNTAATSDYSLAANSAMFQGPYPGGGAPQDVSVPSYTYNVEEGTATAGALGTTASALSERRTKRLGEGPKLYRGPSLNLESG